MKDARASIETWLADGKERIRIVAANALRDIGDPASVPALVVALDDPVFTVRNTAARALVSFGDDAVSALNKVVRPGSVHRRCLADLGAVEANTVLDAGTRVDGSFYHAVNSSEPVRPRD